MARIIGSGKAKRIRRKCSAKRAPLALHPWPSDGLIFFCRDETAGRLPVSMRNRCTPS